MLLHTLLNLSSCHPRRLTRRAVSFLALCAALAGCQHDASPADQPSARSSAQQTGSPCASPSATRTLTVQQVKPYAASGFPEGVQIAAFLVDMDGNVIHLSSPIHLTNHLGQEVTVDPVEYEHLVSQNRTHAEGPIEEGHYLIDYASAFVEFGDNGPRGVEAFEEDLLEATRAVRRGEHDRLGHSAKAFLRAMTHPISAQWTFIVTARDHAPSTMARAWRKALSEFTEAEIMSVVDEHYWPARPSQSAPRTLYLPPDENFVGIKYRGPERSLATHRLKSDPELDPDDSRDLGAIKFRAISWVLRSLSKVPLPTNPVWVTDAMSRHWQAHLAGFSEDSSKNITSVAQAMARAPFDPELGFAQWAAASGPQKLSPVLVTLFPHVLDKNSFTLMSSNPPEQNLAHTPFQVLFGKFTTFDVTNGAGLSPTPHAYTDDEEMALGNTTSVIRRWPEPASVSRITSSDP
jgi:hypothetical protein